MVVLINTNTYTLSQPQTHKCVHCLHKPAVILCTLCLYTHSACVWVLCFYTSPCSDIFLSFILTTFKTTEKLQVECIVLPVNFRCCICLQQLNGVERSFYSLMETLLEIAMAMSICSPTACTSCLLSVIVVTAVYIHWKQA